MKVLFSILHYVALLFLGAAVYAGCSLLLGNVFIAVVVTIVTMALLQILHHNVCRLRKAEQNAQVVKGKMLVMVCYVLVLMGAAFPIVHGYTYFVEGREVILDDLKDDKKNFQTCFTAIHQQIENRAKLLAATERGLVGADLAQQRTQNEIKIKQLRTILDSARAALRYENKDLGFLDKTISTFDNFDQVFLYAIQDLSELSKQRGVALKAIASFYDVCKDIKDDKMPNALTRYEIMKLNSFDLEQSTSIGAFVFYFTALLLLLWEVFAIASPTSGNIKGSKVSGTYKW